MITIDYDKLVEKDVTDIIEGLLKAYNIKKKVPGLFIKEYGKEKILDEFDITEIIKYLSKHIDDPGVMVKIKKQFQKLSEQEIRDIMKQKVKI